MGEELRVHKRKKKVHKRKESSPFNYSRPYYNKLQELPDIAKSFPAKSGFDFTSDWWYAYDGRDADGEPKYNPIHKKFNNFLFWRHVNEELSAKLPLHPAGGLVIIDCYFQDTESMIYDTFIYGTIVNSLRQAPIHQDADHTLARKRLYYKFKEVPAGGATWQKWIDLVKKQIPSYVPEGVLKTIHIETASMNEVRNTPKYIDLPGSKAWPIAVKESSAPQRRDPKRGDILEYEITPIENREEIFEAFLQDPTPLPDVLKKLRSEGDVPQREELDSLRNDMPDFNYGAGTRHEMQPRIALWSIGRYGFDFDAFCRAAQWYDNGSKDMKKRKGERDLHYIWDWAQKAYNPRFSNYCGATPLVSGTSLPAKIARQPYNIQDRDEIQTLVYNSTLGTYEQFHWYYHARFKFSKELNGLLEPSLVAIAKRLGIGGKSPYALVKNAIRLYEILFENVHWHRTARRNARYVKNLGLPSSFDYAPVFSKEHRRKLCAALNIPQHDAIWKLLRTSGLIGVLKDEKGYTYSYKGDRRYAQHITTPNDKLYDYVKELWTLVSLSDKTRNGHNVDLQSFLHNSILSSITIQLLLTNPLNYSSNYSSTSKARVNTSIKGNHTEHNICVKGIERRKPPD